ncbi:MAG TPA: VOC family protein [Acidimicrobiales bacterium]|jgi:PhnB protein|nr:VOC family protein [Acidimicrobiales bacterium]MDP6214134.1 VOC family protein [Acidimicrobiales bacterium]MDP7209557.1 VOC family protein [Acidimicrobiales bacterium]HJL89899.1 VOC family protein [Acidimicrobiales bacterium]HJO98221.1 VOC family protein [Acidimicrobiales bacterium]|tara:strand:- start:29357 stop:29845 length:489 start_codon:yes stop_codon:yes gene_type:complete
MGITTMADAHRPLRTDVIPEIVVDGTSAALTFYDAAFGAEELFRHETENGRIIHAQVSFNGFVIFVTDDFPEMHGGVGTSPMAIGGTPICLHRDVVDVDAAVGRAVAGGATLVHGPEDMFWGDRYARLSDPFGYQWSLATPGPGPDAATTEEAEAEFGNLGD